MFQKDRKKNPQFQMLLKNYCAMSSELKENELFTKEVLFSLFDHFCEDIMNTVTALLQQDLFKIITGCENVLSLQTLAETFVMFSSLLRLFSANVSVARYQCLV